MQETAVKEDKGDQPPSPKDEGELRTGVPEAWEV